MKVRIAVAGLGSIAQKAYLPVLTTHPSIDLIGAYSRTKEKAQAIASQFNIRSSYDSLSKLIGEKPDAVFIHSSTASHYEIVSECLKNNIHVYVDKPLSYSIAESEKLIEMADKFNCLLAVGFNRRFAPMYIKAREWFSANGGFHTCLAQKHRTDYQSLSAKETLYDDLIHMIDLLIWLGEDTTKLQQTSIQLNSTGGLEYASGFVKMNQASGYFAMDRKAGIDIEKLELTGNNRSALITNLEEGIFTDKQSGQNRITPGSWDSISTRRGFTGIINHFIESLSQPSSCTVSADKVIASHRFIEEMVRNKR